jgi:hypothetical protein
VQSSTLSFFDFQLSPKRRWNGKMPKKEKKMKFLFVHEQDGG